MGKKKSDNKANIQTVKSNDLALSFEDSIVPRSEAYLAKVGATLKEWVKRPDSFTINGFLAEYQIPPQSFYQWVNKHEHLAFDYSQALVALADRREVGALTKKLDAATVNSSMAMYCSRWKELSEWRAKIKEDAAHHTGKVEIEIKQIPMTGEVTADIERKK